MNVNSAFDFVVLERRTIQVLDNDLTVGNVFCHWFPSFEQDSTKLVVDEHSFSPNARGMTCDRKDSSSGFGVHGSFPSRENERQRFQLKFWLCASGTMFERTKNKRRSCVDFQTRDFASNHGLICAPVALRLFPFRTSLVSLVCFAVDSTTTISSMSFFTPHYKTRVSPTSVGRTSLSHCCVRQSRIGNGGNSRNGHGTDLA
jgi:hypothetical protein